MKCNLNTIYYIRVDNNNYVHISYFDYSYGNLCYVFQNSSGWQGQITLHASESVGWKNSIAIDQNNDVHISYHDHTNYNLKYIYQINGVW